MGRTIGAEWRLRLKRFGFQPQGTGGRKGTYALRTVAPLIHAVGVLVDDRYHDGGFNVQLNVNMPFPYDDEPYDVVLILADLSATGVEIEEPWVHEAGFATWWAPTELEPAWNAFFEFGLPWLEEHSKPGALIDYFEREYQELEATRQKDLYVSPLTKLLGSIGLSSQPRQTGHHQYLLWLSMLYEAQGRIELAIQSLDRYIRWAEKKNMKRKAERLALHRTTLSERLASDGP